VSKYRFRAASSFLPLSLLLLCLLLLLPAAALAKPDFNQAIDQLFANGFPQTVDAHLANMPGTNPQLGFFLTGTWSDNARARYIADQMRDMGLKNVHLSPVPVDAFTFTSASVNVGSHTFVASTFAGVHPTPASGLTAPIVYAHDGSKQDFDALQAAGVSVKGKLVLLDADLWNWWVNNQAAEATSRGAIGIVFTYGADTAPYYSFAPDALGSFDAEFNWSDVPAVYISQQDGAWLESQLAADKTGPVTTMKLIEKVRFATQGGRGYMVFGDLPGTVRDGTFVLFGAHHDAYFHSATDDTDGVVNNLTIAKAMVTSGYKPQHTVRFMFSTGEEFGYVNSYYDWCIGAWYTITHAHPEWAGKIRAFLNSDHFVGDNPLKITSPDFTPLVSADAAAAGSLLPYSYKISATSSTWKDSWSFGAAGVPIVSFDNKVDSAGTYHTQYMVESAIDWPYVAGIAKFIFQVETQFNNGGLLPYGLNSRANSLAATVVPADLLAAGVNAGNVNRLQNDVTAFQNATAAYEARAGSIPATHDAAVNARLLKIQKRISLALTGLTPFQTTVYPHEQVLLDVQSLNQAIAALQASPADTATALSALASVDWTSNGLMLTHSVYLHLLQRLNPSYYRVAWGGEGHPVWPLLDVMPQYNAIQGGAWTEKTIDQLQAMRSHELRDLNSRLTAMSVALEKVTTRINALN
jgi:aminopeptidase YwaD